MNVHTGLSGVAQPGVCHTAGPAVPASRPFFVARELLEVFFKTIFGNFVFQYYLVLFG